MSVFEHGEYRDHQQVGFFHDEASGLRAIVAIHRLVQGRAGGGIRIRDYPDETEALQDVLRLSRAMTYKMAMAGVRVGGAKTVVLGADKTEAKLEALGRIIESFAGRYTAGEDVGVAPEDIPVIKRTTRHIVGGPDDTSSPMTALGVFHGMRAAAEARFGKDSLEGLDVAIQGAGNVAWHLMSHLTEAGARIKVADVNPEAVERARDAYDVEVVDAAEILFQQVDILAPCALGGVLNEKTIPRLQTAIICGCANNQLATSEDDARLREKGLLYVPDYVVNAGGVIASTGIVAGATDAAIRERVESIQDRCRQIIEKAMAEETGTEAAADSLAEEILRNAPA